MFCVDELTEYRMKLSHTNSLYTYICFAFVMLVCMGHVRAIDWQRRQLAEIGNQNEMLSIFVVCLRS